MAQWKITYSLKHRSSAKMFDPLRNVEFAYIAAETKEEAIEKLEEEFNMLYVHILCEPTDSGLPIEA